MAIDHLVDERPSLRPVLFVLALFIGAVAAAAGTTGAAASGGTSGHLTPHHPAHAQVLLASRASGHR